MTNPMGTLVCPHCGVVQCGKLDLICDECERPHFDIRQMEKAITYERVQAITMDWKNLSSKEKKD